MPHVRSAAAAAAAAAVLLLSSCSSATTPLGAGGQRTTGVARTTSVPHATLPPLTHGPARLAYVTEQNANVVAVVSLAQHRVVATVPVGRAPDAMTITHDHRTLIVGNFGYRHPGRTLSVIDAASGKVVRTVTIGGRPAAIAVAPNGRTAWVTDNLGGTIVPVDLRSWRVGKRFHIGSNPLGIVVSPNGKTAYVIDTAAQLPHPELGEHTLQRVDLVTGKVTGTVSVGFDPCAITLSRDGSTAWVTVDGKQAFHDGTLVAVNTSTLAIDHRTTVGTQPAGVELSPDGTTAYALAGTTASMSGHGEVFVVDTAEAKVVKRIPVGSEPWEITLSPDGSTAWVVDAHSQDLRAVDLGTGRAAPAIAVPGHPHQAEIVYGP